MPEIPHEPNPLSAFTVFLVMSLSRGRKKERFYLTTHSTHFFKVIRRLTYSRGPLRKRKRKPAAATWATLSDQQQWFFYMHHPTDRITHTTVFVTQVVEHWLEREISQWVHPMDDRSDDPSHHERTLLPRSYIFSLTWTLHEQMYYKTGTFFVLCFYDSSKEQIKL